MEQSTVIVPLPDYVLKSGLKLHFTKQVCERFFFTLLVSTNPEVTSLPPESVRLKTQHFTQPSSTTNINSRLCTHPQKLI